MKFVDNATIYVEAGHGGHGCMSLKREAFMPKGGPDGGDGGNGGDVYLQASLQLNTLLPFKYQNRFVAKRGGDGSGNQKTGKSAPSLYIEVPIGTEVYNQPTGELLGTLLRDQQCLLVARGGEHGLGNIHFKSSTRQTPRIRTMGTAGDERCLQLKLKILAEVGLLGVPNAGKSTLLQAMTEAKPKIADYPFTTTYPNLGVVQLDRGQSFVIVDMPGLVDESVNGRGLGIEFLKHIEHAKVLLQIIDSSSDDDAQIDQQIEIIEEALRSHSEQAAHKPRWLIFNKMKYCKDLALFKAKMTEKFAQRYPCWFVSSLEDDGVGPLCQAIGNQLGGYQ